MKCYLMFFKLAISLQSTKFQTGSLSPFLNFSSKWDLRISSMLSIALTIQSIDPLTSRQEVKFLFIEDVLDDLEAEGANAGVLVKVLSKQLEHNELKIIQPYHQLQSMLGCALTPVVLHPRQNNGVNLERVYFCIENSRTFWSKKRRLLRYWQDTFKRWKAPFKNMLSKLRECMKDCCPFSGIPENTTSVSTTFQNLLTRIVSKKSITFCPMRIVLVLETTTNRK